MKKINLLFLLVLCGLTASAQADLFTTPYKWQVKKWGLSFGNDMDMLGSVEHGYLLSTIRGNTNMDYSNLQFEEQNVESMTCENPHVRLTLSLPVPKMRNAELNVSAILVANKIDAVSYYDYNRTTGSQWLRFSSITNEAGVEAVFLKRGTLLGSFLNLYGGIGSNIGASFGGEVRIEGYDIQTNNDNQVMNFSDYDGIPANNVVNYDYIYETHQSKTSFHQRAFGQLGFGLLFAKRVELGFEYRLGYGFRAISGATTKGTEYHSAAINLAWRMK